MIITINWNMCDGCGRCVEICPLSVLELKEISQVDYKELRWLGKMKVKFKGSIKAQATNEIDCIGCGKCADNCHENAIRIKGQGIKRWKSNPNDKIITQS